MKTLTVSGLKKTRRNTMLNIGECVIYGSHGLCSVRDILVPSFLERGKEKEYYQMVSAVDAESVLYVPVEVPRARSVM